MASDSSSPDVPPCLPKARWIWPESLHWDLPNHYALFRHRFTLADVPATAPLIITADQSYQLYLNGHYIGRGPGRGFQAEWPYDEIDVAAWLQPGDNVIAVRAYNPGCSNYQYRSEGYAGLLVAADWGSVRVATGDHWRCRRQAGVRRDTPPASLQLFRQEHIDLRIEDPTWMEPGFDDSGDEWSPKIASARWDAMPWFALRPRGTARLEESVEPYDHVIGTARGKSRDGYREERHLGHLRARENLTHQPADQEKHALQFAPVETGQWQSVLLDLGKPRIGADIVEIEGAQGGEIVELHHFETCTVDEAGITPDYRFNSHCHSTYAHRLTCHAGAQRHDFYHAYGTRYVVITVRDNAAPLTLRFAQRATLYPLPAQGSFAADPELEAIWQCCAWTQRICSLDAYVDTPGREQAQWWGDARVQAWNTFHLNGDTRLLRNGIHLIGTQRTPDGLTYGHAPTIAHHCILPDFTLIWLLTLWDHYWQTGDPDLFVAQHEGVTRALAYFRDWTCAETGLLRHDERHWLFLDWADLPKDGQPAVYSLWLLHALDRLHTLYQLTGDTTSAADCASWAARLREALTKLVDPGTGLLVDGYSPEGERLTSTSVHTQALALITNLVPEHHEAMVNRRLLPSVQGGEADVVQPSAYWITYVYSLLGESGHGDAVIEDIRRRWAPMVEHGSTWETFDPPRGEFSFSHAWSAHPLFHLMQILGGVRQATAGWSEVNFCPTFGGPGADVTLPTPHGSIRSHWRREEDTIHGQLILPAGISAHTTLPGQDPATVQGTWDFTCVQR